MATPPGFAAVSYELKHSAMSRSAFLTFGCDPAATDPAAIALQAAASFGAAGSLKTVIDSQVSLVRTRVSLGTDGFEDIVGENAVPVACTATFNSGPPNCALLVRKLTARGGRRGRGRMYIPWCYSASSMTESGIASAGEVTALGNACTVWLTQMATNPGPVVLLHRESKPGTEHPTTPGPPNVVTQMVVDNLVATQRRRTGR